MDQMEELLLLIDKVTASEDLYSRAETYYLEHCDDWSPEITSYFQDYLQRKLDQIHYEWHRVQQMGMSIHTGRADRRIDHDI